MLAAAVPRPLSKGEIHVWRLDLAGGCPADLERVVSDGDLIRAGRFAFDRDRNRFLRAKYGLRRLLSAYAGMAPRELAIALDGHGKPHLDPALGLGFNLSHSGDHGLVAIGRTARIGVDIEEMSAPRNMRTLANRLFTADEVQSLMPLDASSLAVAFLTCWTRKEAYLKALGVGLSVAPCTVHVGTAPRRCRFPIAGGRPDEFVEVTSLAQADGCVAALAVEGGAAEPENFDFNWDLSPETWESLSLLARAGSW